jgi:cytolysin-activating lysine-acyltransferase
MLFGKKSGTEEKSPPPQAEPANGAQAAPNAAAAQNGAAKLNPEDAKKRVVAAKQMAAAFGEIVTLLMRSPTDRHHSLTDLEWLVVPAVVRGQFGLAEAQSKETGAVAPAGAVLWALVSEEVDKRLSDLSTPLRLKPDEWRSGDIPWIVLAAGDMRVLGGLIQQLTKTVLKGKQPKMRVRGPDGKVTVGHLDIKEKAAAAGA